MSGYINNPNVAGATILSLGCQHAQISIMQRSLNRMAPNLNKPVYFLEQQSSSSEPEYIAECIKKTFVGLIKANSLIREKAPLSKLILGLECGGSDGFSGDRGRVRGVNARSSRARSCCKNRYLVTLTFAPLERNRGSRAQTHKNSMVFVNFCPGPRHDRQAASDAADVCC